MIARLLAMVRGFAARRRIDDEIAEEMRDHLEREIEMHVARGVPPDEARRLALRDFGGVAQSMESTRDIRTTWFDSAIRDTRYAIRFWRRSPRFTAIALTLLVLGIGATTAIFSIAYAVLLRPLPYPESSRLVYLAENSGNGTSWLNFLDWKSRARSFDGLAGSVSDAVNLTNGPVPRRFDAKVVTANFFQVLRVTPFRGRLFDDADARSDAPPTVVVSYEFWMRELGGAPNAIGGTLSIGNEPVTLIGVLQPGFRYMTPADVFTTLERRVATNYRGMQSRNSRTSFLVVGRLTARASFESARAEMRSIVAALAVEYPEANKNNETQIMLLADRIVGPMSATLTVCAGAVALLLVIACVNLAGLLLSRSAARAHELAIRAAIGGSRRALMQQLLIEHSVLVLAGGVLGAAAGVAMLRGLLIVAPPDLPRLNEIQLDPLVLFWTTLVSCVCAFVLALLPALKASGANGQAFISRPSIGASRSVASLRRGLMIAELAVATVLLAGSGVMVRTMVRLANVDPGFDPSHLQTARFSMSGEAWPDDKKASFYEAVTTRIRETPGVEGVAISYSLPFRGSNWWTTFTIAGRVYPATASPNAGIVPVTAGFFEMMKIPLLRGRSFDRSETPESAPVAIVNATLAAEYWPGQNPVGQQIRLGGPNDGFGPVRTVVGVVGNVKQHGADQEPPRQLFLPIVQQPLSPVFVIVRTRVQHSDSLLENAIHTADPTVPVFNDRTFDQIMRDASSRRRIAMIVLSAFGAVAVLLAAIGLYGVIAQGVAERRQEIGVRMALGATRSHILRLFIGQSLQVVAFGTAIGIVAAIATGRSLASLVFGVTAADPATLGAVSSLLMVVSLLASYLPARSATRTDPFKGLRSE